MAELRFNVSDSQAVPFKLHGELTTLGRDPDNSIVIDNNYISTFHAEIRFDSAIGKYEVVDLGSYNGTKVNREKIVRCHLEEGDSIQFGQLSATLHLGKAKPKAKSSPIAAAKTPPANTTTPLPKPKPAAMRPAARGPMAPTSAAMVKPRPPGHRDTTRQVPPVSKSKELPKPPPVPAAEAHKIQKSPATKALIQAVPIPADKISSPKPADSPKKEPTIAPAKQDLDLDGEDQKGLKKERKALKAELAELAEKVTKRKAKVESLSKRTKELDGAESRLAEIKTAAEKSGAKLETSVAERDELKSVLEQARGARDEVKAELDSLSTKRDELLAERETVQNSINELHGSKNKLTEAQQLAVDEFEKLGSERIRLDREHGDLREAIALLQAELSEFTNKRDDANDAFEESKRAFEEELDAARTAAEEQVNELVAKAALLANEQKQTANDLEETRGSIAELEESKAAVQAEGEAAAEVIAKIETEKAASAEQLTAIKADIVTTLHAKQAAETTAAKTRSTLDADRDRLATERDDLGQRVEVLRGAEERLAEAKIRYESLEPQVVALGEQKASLDAEVIESRKAYADYQEVKGNLTRDRDLHKTAQAELSETEHQLAATRATLAEVTDNKNAADTEFANLSESIATAEERAHTLRAESGASEAAVHAARGQLAEINTEITDAGAAKAHTESVHADTKSAAQTELSALEQAAETARAAAAQADAKNAELGKANAAIEAAIAASESRSVVLEAGFVERSTQFDAANQTKQDELERIEQILQERSGELGAAGKKLGEVQNAYAELVTAIATGNEQKTALEQNIAALTEQTEELEARKKDLAKTEQNLDKRRAEVAAADEKKRSLESDRTAIERELLETKSTVAKRNDTIAELDAQVTDLDAKREEHGRISAELTDLKKQLAILGNRRAEIAHTEAKLEAALKEFGDVTLRGRREREELDETKGELQQVRNDLQNLSGESRRLGELRSQLDGTTRELDERRQRIADSEAEIAKLEGIGTRVREETHDLEVRAQKYQTVRGEIERIEARAGELQSAQTKLKGAEDRLDEAKKEEKHLSSEIKRLREKKKSLGKAPDLEWGTIHLFSRSMFKRIDLMDDLIARYKRLAGESDIPEQLDIMRSSMVDALAEHDVELFDYAPDSEIALADRSRIKIVDVERSGSEDKPRVIATLRPGFVCSNGSAGKPTVLRKAEVTATAS
jgi:chromosome segregation ATPase